MQVLNTKQKNVYIFKIAPIKENYIKIHNVYFQEKSSSL